MRRSIDGWVSGLRVGVVRRSDYNLRCLDQSCGRLALLQTKVATGLAGDDGRDNLAANVEQNLGQQSHNFNLGYQPISWFRPLMKCSKPPAVLKGRSVRFLGTMRLSPRRARRSISVISLQNCE